MNLIYSAALLLAFLLSPPHADSAIITSTQPTIQEQIVQQAALYKVDSRIAVAIAKCESHLNPQAHNPSGASGLYQFLGTTWTMYAKRHWGVTETRSVYNASDSIDLAMWVMGNYGTNDWLASKQCWGS